MKSIVLFLFSLFSLRELCAQVNLVPNPSFENFDSVTTFDKISNFKLVRNWYNPVIKTTPDFYHLFEQKRKSNLPKNRLGTQFPRTGLSYVGIIPESDKWYEYIGVKLNLPLEKDKLYKVSLFTALGIDCTIATNELDFTLTTKKLKRFFLFSNYIHLANRNEINSVISNKIKWIEVSKCFKAIGNEQYLTIGCFNSSKIEYLKINDKHPGVESYYYIDDVSVIEVKDSCECMPLKDTLPQKNMDTLTIKEIEDKHRTGIWRDTVIIPVLEFDVNSAMLDLKYYEGLDFIIANLDMNHLKSIEIGGHTDSSGIENKNVLLSEQRAKSVFDYFSSKGIPKEKMKYHGFGSSIPIKPNNSEVNKEHNRRVEIRISMK